MKHHELLPEKTQQGAAAPDGRHGHRLQPVAVLIAASTHRGGFLSHQHLSQTKMQNTLNLNAQRQGENKIKYIRKCESVLGGKQYDLFSGTSHGTPGRTG